MSHWRRDGIALCFSLKKPLSSAVHPGTEGAAHHREGDASELSLTSRSLIVIAMVLEVYDGMC